jgi:hypothetical protein
MTVIRGWLGRWESKGKMGLLGQVSFGRDAGLLREGLVELGAVGQLA